MTEKELEKLAIEARRAYYRNWRASNKEKVKMHNANYWKKRALKLAAEKQEKSGDEK